MTVEVSHAFVAQSILELQKAGNIESERVLLWLGKRKAHDVRVTEIFVPLQVANYDFFSIPPSSMRALLQHLREKELMVAAQMHSHPEEAFHSQADDRWAIVRHEGALSIVLPYFARTSSVENFLETSATFALSAQNEWRRVSSARLANHLRVQ